MLLFPSAMSFYNNAIGYLTRLLSDDDDQESKQEWFEQATGDTPGERARSQQAFEHTLDMVSRLPDWRSSVAVDRLRTEIADVEEVLLELKVACRFLSGEFNSRLVVYDAAAYAHNPTATILAEERSYSLAAKARAEHLMMMMQQEKHDAVKAETVDASLVSTVD